MGNRYSQRASNEDPGKDKNDKEGGEVREERQRGQDEEVDRPTEQIGKISFTVLLRCTSHGSTVESTHTLTVRTFPESVAELKKAIQNEFYIPIYDQKLSFGFSVMDDSNASFVLLLIAAFRDALEFLRGIQTQLTSGNVSFEFSKQMLHAKDIDRYV